MATTATADEAPKNILEDVQEYDSDFFAKVIISLNTYFKIYNFFFSISASLPKRLSKNLLPSFRSHKCVSNQQQQQR